MNFHTDFRYKARQDKFKYVWLKYQPILEGNILDVGADECYLRDYLPADTNYWGIGLGGSPDQQVNLEEGVLPFADNSYDCVMCLDVLEHLESAHAVFDELCRVSSRYVIVSLPNAWAGILNHVLFGDSSPNQHIKYYGMPPEPQLDRHRWFMSYEEGEHFVRERARINGFSTIQVDAHLSADTSKLKVKLLHGVVRTGLRFTKADPNIFLAGTMWAVLEKGSN